MYNIIKDDCSLMLSSWVSCKLLATIYLHRYRDRYPWHSFVLVEKV